MIDIQNKKDCTGCNACYDICPKDAILLNVDMEGFWYPSVDKDKCNDCGLCERTCPVIHIEEVKKNEFQEPVCYAAIHKNIEVRFGSTSGGLFSALAGQMYREGGYVGGAIFSDDFSVRHLISNHSDDLQRLRQSKYAQSHTEGIFREVKKLLTSGEKVLICGTPCQMAALRQYLNKDYENLIIIDFICKSITSPKFFAKYLDYWERKVGSKLVAFKFKDKELGWRNLVKRFNFENGKTLYSKAGDNDIYSFAYHNNIVSRPSCYECVFKGYPRIADISIADFWGIERYAHLKDLDDDAGTSAVMINNAKGMNFFDKIKHAITAYPANIEEIMQGNPSLTKAQNYPACDREAFFRDLDAKPIEDVVSTLLGKKMSLKKRLKIFLTPFYKGIKYSQYKPFVFFKFIRLNFFCKKVKINWKNEGFIYPTPYSVIELQKGAQILLHGPFIVGAKKARKSKQETIVLLEKNAQFTVEERFNLVYGSTVEVFEGAHLKIGNCGTNHGCTIICGKSIELRGRVSLGRNVSIRDTNAHTIAIDGYKVFRPVVIENHTWICSGATICPGVKVKEGAVVGACSYVVQNVPAHTLVSGHPAKVTMTNIAWKL